MKLTNLNCPQCNGFLKQERDAFFCESCGAAFVVDYDENDVKYTELVTEAERTKMLLARDVELLATNYQLKETVARNEQKRENVKETKNAFKVSFFGVGVMSAIFILGIIVLIVFILLFSDSSDKETAKALDEKNAQYDKYSEAVLKDEAFIDNTIALGRARNYLFFHDLEITDDYVNLKNGTAHLTCDPEILNVYLFKLYGKADQIFLTYKMTFEYEDGGEQFELYDGFCFSGFGMNDYGQVEFDMDDFFIVTGIDPKPYYEEEQIYREYVLEQKGKREVVKLQIPGKEEEV
ncbi:MAG: hypothetical protein IKZ90_10980 [Clostridiales bacterium]|nr:hypothetical protein [Clostridiales bacterium]